MIFPLAKNCPPKTESELLERCLQIEGMTFAQLGACLEVQAPYNALQRKGWIGQVLERILGSDAGNQAEPDFKSLGVELKTLPIGNNGIPIESTFVTSIPLLTIHKQTWKLSECYNKLKRVLWIPIEGDTTISFSQRRIGRGILWSPNSLQESLLAADWEYLTTQMSTGSLETLDATYGDFLQVRPKAANAKSLCYGYDAKGNKFKTLPRGFYLRSRFTKSIF